MGWKKERDDRLFGLGGDILGDASDDAPQGLCSDQAADATWSGGRFYPSGMGSGASTYGKTRTGSPGFRSFLYGNWAARSAAN